MSASDTSVVKLNLLIVLNKTMIKTLQNDDISGIMAYFKSQTSNFETNVIVVDHRDKRHNAKITPTKRSNKTLMSQTTPTKISPELQKVFMNMIIFITN